MGQANPFEKYLSKEQVMQAETSRLLSLKYPDLLWWHTQNEGKRTPFEQYVFKEMGGLSGVSDFVILEEGNFSKGLMIEIKWGTGSCTKKQVDFLIASAKKGYTAAVVYNDARDVLDLVSKHMVSGTCFPDDGILLIKNGKQTVIPFADAYKVLIKKNTEKTDLVKAKAMFKDNALKKFGKIEKSKLFKSPRDE